MATAAVLNPTDGISTAPETQQQNDAEVAIELPFKFIADLYDASSHCKEPENHHSLEHQFEHAVQEDYKARGVDTTSEAEALKKKWLAYPYPDDVYVVDFDNDGIPTGHDTWLPGFQLEIQVEETEDGRSTGYFQVFESKDEAELVLNTEDFKSSRGFDVPRFDSSHSDGGRLLWSFGKKYPLGAAMLDENGRPRFKHYTMLNKYNYAEHAYIGNNIKLKWPEKEGSRGEALKLENGKSLSYGQINALGGDFFATYMPICMGKSDEERVEYFMNAYNMLAQDDKDIAQKIIENRQEEVDLVQGAVDSGKSAFDVYKGPELNKAGKMPLVGKLVGEENESLLAITIDGKGPSYVRMAQLNLDHFGQNAVLAYNAGHTCALRAAAKGDLNLAYTLNAFADHFLGDQFAAGHLRTPRSKLHGNDADVQEGIDVAMKALEDFNITLKDDSYFAKVKMGMAAVKLTTNSKIWKTIQNLAPDMCSKYMHDEDNYLGLYVANRRGEKWRAYGDKKLFETPNKRNKDMMLECLQASADEVYEAYKTKQVITSDKFVVWDIAPSEVLPNNHAPLFDSRGWVREELGNSECRTYVDPSNWKYMYLITGFAGLAISLVKTDVFTKY